MISLGRILPYVQPGWKRRLVAPVRVAGSSIKLTTKFSSQVNIPISGKTVEFDSIFLRDSCSCHYCVDPSTSQKNFQTSDIPRTILGSYSRSGSKIRMDWKNDISGFPETHQTILDPKFLQGTVNQKISRYTIPRVLWENQRMTRDNIFIDHEDYQKSDRVLHQTLSRLQTHGLVFLKNVPDSTDSDSSKSLKSIMSRIGCIRSTFYGLTWDVRSIPEAKNVAYTDKFLGFHMDLCYMDLTPQFQFLHSMRSRAPGGESMFADSFLAAERIRKHHPDLFEALRTFPVTYHYYNAGQSYRQVRNTVELMDDKENSPMKLVNWSPPFQGPFSNIDSRELRRYHAAAQKFNELISDPANTFELRMYEGECVIFDNRRVLHARRGFDVSKGERWLKGAYLDRDVFASRFARLDEVYGSNQKPAA